MVLHLDPSLASHNFGRGMTETARAPMLTPNVYANVMRLPQLAVRSLGLAARFVSGYLHVPSRDGPKYVGGGSTHAWCQVYLPGAVVHPDAAEIVVSFDGRSVTYGFGELDMLMPAYAATIHKS
jgi:Transglutaminase-like superfamily